MTFGNIIAFQSSLPKSFRSEGDTVTIEDLDIKITLWKFNQASLSRKSHA